MRCLFMGFWEIVEEVIKECDIVVFVIDARMPQMSSNPQLERIASDFGKPILRVFTKKDLLSSEELDNFMKKHHGELLVSGIKNQGVSFLKERLYIMSKKMRLTEPKIGFVGYPNVGKSALINALAKRARTKVSDKPGTTRGVQWIRVGSLRILDTPGVIPYKEDSLKLALIGSKSPEKLSSPEKVAFQIIKEILNTDKKILEERYKINLSNEISEEEVLKLIGQKRGFLKRGGFVDETKSAICVIRDWQNGKLSFNKSSS